MKKTLLALALSLLCVVFFALAVSAESITVADDGTTDISLGECVIDGLGREIPEASRGFTYVLDTEAKTAKITSWANYADKELGKAFVIPSTVTYGGNTYTVTTFDDVVKYTDNGKGSTQGGNYILVSVFIPDTVVSIPASAFQSCAAIEYVYIGSGLETWGELAFYFAGCTAGGYYVTVEEEVTNEETGEVTTTTKNVRIEETGANMGDIKEFILKSKKVTELPKQIFEHTEFDKTALIDVDITQFKTFGYRCIALNNYALTGNHHFKGTGIRFDVFDLRGAETIHDEAFFYAYGGKVMIINAEQTKYFNLNSIRSNSAEYYNEDTGNDGYLIIYGGESADTAKTLGGPIWTADAFYWYQSTVFMNVIIKGYVNAYDGVDGLSRQNGYGIDQGHYFFESVDAMNYYFNSIASTTDKDTTYARYAQSSKGYFNVCNSDCKTANGYNVKLNSESGAYELLLHVDKNNVPVAVATDMTCYEVVGDNCTASTLCFMCGKELVAGAPHSMASSLVYANGYLEAGAHVEYCTNKDCEHKNETPLEALFTNLGYSVNTTNGYGVIQSFKINKEALDKYAAKRESFEFGVVASTIENPLDENGAVADENKVVKVNIKTVLDVFEIIVNNIGESYLDSGLICCGYVIDNGEVSYLNNGKTVDNVELKSYNELKELLGGSTVE